MVRLFIRHNVDDYDAWRKTYYEFDAQRGPMGVRGDAVFWSLDDPNDITVWHDFDSDDAARAVASSQELRDGTQRAGVQGEPQIWFVSEA
jgi:hypothetical protein